MKILLVAVLDLSDELPERLCDQIKGTVENKFGQFLRIDGLVPFVQVTGTSRHVQIYEDVAIDDILSDEEDTDESETTREAGTEEG